MSNNATPLIMGLDISKTRTGIAWGRVGDVPKFTSIEGADVNNTKAAFKLFRWLSSRTKLDRFDGVFIEAQIGMGAFMGKYDEAKGKVQMTSNPDTVLALAKMVGAAELVCEGRSILNRNPAVATVRKAFVGHGRLPGKEAKAAVRMMCAELGWSPSNNDEADAGAVWWYGGLQLKPHACQIITPMMQQRILSLCCPSLAKLGGVHAAAI